MFYKDQDMEKNLTSGSVFKSVVSFSLPFLLSYFLQTLYGLADLFIIGLFCEVESTTAVSVGSQVMHMLTVVVVGLAMGSTVMIGRAVGAGDKKQAARFIGNTVTLFTLASAVLTAVLLLSAGAIVAAVATPPEAVEQTRTYLMICFAGTPFIVAYNIISSIFRGMGDSKSPMYFVAVACAVNIALDCLFIGGLGMGAAGAALGTVLAQTVSVLAALIFIRKKPTGIHLSKGDFRLDREITRDLLKIGVPVAMQDGCIQIAFLVITAIANSRGLHDAAAVGIVEKIIGILFLIPSSMLSSVSALAAQNVGAQKHDRARLVLRYAVGICTAWGLLCIVVMELVPSVFVGLFTDNAAVTEMGTQYLRGYVFDCLFAGIHFCFSGFFCAYGKSGYSFLHNIISITCARIPLAYAASALFPDTLLPMGIATALGSVVSVVICVILYRYGGTRLWRMRVFD